MFNLLHISTGCTFFKSSHVLVQLWTLNTVIFLYYRFGGGHFLLNVFYFVVSFKCIRTEFFCFVFKNANVQVFFSERKIAFFKIKSTLYDICRRGIIIIVVKQWHFFIFKQITLPIMIKNIPIMQLDN